MQDRKIGSIEQVPFGIHEMVEPSPTGCRRETVHPLICTCVLLIGTRTESPNRLQVNRNDLYHWQIITHPTLREEL